LKGGQYWVNGYGPMHS